ncbi:hypothetical protein [Winogradskyella sp. PE311]|uniref:hypothetical protein n=1 Tax=Winogradskyella sp. PE311 TaxID=3366943 RepID=UPI00397F442D
MKHLTTILLALIILNSCNKSNKTFATSDGKIKVFKEDTSQIEGADLPIHLDSTEYLIHAIGKIDTYNSRSFLYSESNKMRNMSSYNISRNNNFTITGELTNIKFQNFGSEELVTLTEDNLKITSVTYLNKIADEENKLLIYTIYDADTNKDSQLDYEDIKTLYISNIDGSNFKKLTQNLDQLIDWKLVSPLNRIYFRSITDSNKNGEFDTTDKINYQYVNLKNQQFKVESYHPVQ